MMVKKGGEERMRKHYRKGQSILEYTLLLGAIIAVIVAVLLGGGSGGIRGQVNNTYSKFGDAVEKTTNDLSVGVFK
jgi:Flp pilus assembly pilin Flp